jgi:uncharacterized protein (TIGR00304 family)
LIEDTLSNLGFALISIGFVVAFIAVMIMIFSATKKGEGIKGGGLVMIGPLPIIFGSDEDSKKSLLLLVIVLIVIFILFSFQTFG